MLLLFLEDFEDAAWRRVAFRAGAHGRATDEDAVAINVHGLLGDAHQDHERTARRELRLPPIFARLERSGRPASWRSLGVKRRLLHGLCGGKQGGGDGEDAKYFHE